MEDEEKLKQIKLSFVEDLKKLTRKELIEYISEYWFASKIETEISEKHKKWHFFTIEAITKKMVIGELMNDLLNMKK